MPLINAYFIQDARHEGRCPSLEKQINGRTEVFQEEKTDLLK